MATPYVPARDAALDVFAANFSTLITANPATYGLAAGDATIIAGLNTTWHAAFLAAKSPSTRTPQSVQAKNIARANLLATVRAYAQTIANNAAVTSANKIALGLNPRTNGPQPIAAPTTNPNLTIQQASTLTHVIRYRDSAAAPSVKSKPTGAIAMQLYCTPSATPITDATLLTYKGQVTKSPFQVSFNSADAGKQAYYAARWVTRTGKVGPWSSITNFTVAA